MNGYTLDNIACNRASYGVAQPELVVMLARYVIQHETCKIDVFHRGDTADYIPLTAVREQAGRGPTHTGIHARYKFRNAPIKTNL
jgi:hypothetical protein